MNLNELKEAANKDRANYGGEIGFAENDKYLVTAKKWGANKPNRKENIRYQVTEK